MTEETKPRKPGTFVKGHPGYKPKGALNKINRTTKEAMDEAAAIVGGKEGKVGVFTKVADKDIVAFGHMLARSMPMEVKAEVNNVAVLGPVNIIEAPRGMFVTQAQNEHLNRTGQLLSPEEAEAAERSFNGPRAEPEVLDLMARVTKRKPGDDLA